MLTDNISAGKDAEALMELIPLTDSRSLTNAPQTVFFALRTATGDGHRYIPDLYRRGVRKFVVETGYIPADDMADATFIVVDSPLDELQRLAAQKRRASSARVVGITGSRGKTLVKEWLAGVAGQDMSVCRSPRSYNSQIGVALSVWQLSGEHALGVFEAGISRKGEMERLANIINPDIAVLTSVGSDHDDGFASREEKIAEKLRLATGISSLVYPADDAAVCAGVEALKTQSPRIELRGWTKEGKPGAWLDVKISESGSNIRISYNAADGRSGEFTLPSCPSWQIDNACTVVATLLALGYAPADIDSRMAGTAPTGTRMQVTDGVNNCLIVHDDYLCDLSSLSLALDFVGRRATANRTLTVILSDIASDGGDADCDDTYRRAGEMLRQRGVSRVIGIGADISARFALLEIDGCCFASTAEALEHLTPTDFNSELILLKGSPVFEFTLLVNLLEAKTHETVLEVNLDAMVDNFNFFRSKLKPTTGIVCMVKASGYGAGSLELAKTLQTHGAAYLAVAVGDEGAELRRAGVTMPIMVLNPMVLNYKQLFDNQLEPEIFSFESLEAIIYEAKRAGMKDYPVHIKLDTGMHRLGFREEDIPALLEVLDSTDAVRPRSVFSHLATADCLDQDVYTLGQLEYYHRCSTKIVEHFPFKVLRHVLNTAGMLRFPEYQYDMCRLGIGLYGIPVLNNGTEDALRPISSLRSVIIAIHRWEPGTTVGYGRHGVISRPSLVATVPIGYADGFNRHCGRGRWKVAVNGRLCPTVGNICMDICMIDVTDVPGVRTGDAVTIFGPLNPATAMAEVLDTIPYECLTSVSPRVRRVYYRES